MTAAQFHLPISSGLLNMTGEIMRASNGLGKGTRLAATGVTHLARHSFHPVLVFR
jgi:hypothetical protein